jgi:hypothetical protein
MADETAQLPVSQYGEKLSGQSQAVQVDSSGNIWVATQNGSGGLKEFSSSGSWVRTIGRPCASHGRFNFPEQAGVR